MASIAPSSSDGPNSPFTRSEEHTSELQSHSDLVCRLLLEKKNKNFKKTWSRQVRRIDPRPAHDARQKPPHREGKPPAIRPAASNRHHAPPHSAPTQTTPCD